MTYKVLLMIFFWFSLSLSSFVFSAVFSFLPNFYGEWFESNLWRNFFVVSFVFLFVLLPNLMNPLLCETRDTHKRWNHLLNSACLITRDIFESFSPKFSFIASLLCAVNFYEEWSRRVGVYCSSALYQIWLNSLTRKMSEYFCSVAKHSSVATSTVGICWGFVMETRTQWWSVN